MTAMAPRLSRLFFRRDPVTLARALLGQRLVRVLENGTRLAGRIVETEAYLGVCDRAAHTFGGRRTARNASMWLDGGHAYVYFTYGLHHCVNIVAQRQGIPTAVLIRALEPVEGLSIMRRRRRRLPADELCSGPAKLAQALAIDRRLDGVDLCVDPRLSLERAPSVDAGRIVSAPRVGVDYAGRWARRRLRFYERGNPHVSVP
jgi:DNA-3-methyladenine glycosylase